MIGSLRGKIIGREKNWLELETGGIGWLVFLSSRDLSQLKVGEEQRLYIFHHVAENINDLYGFLRRRDRDIFSLLLSVNGIGPRTALEIFAVADGERILRAIAEADVAFFQQVRGIGKKGAQRIIVDLRSQVGEIKDLDLKSEFGGREEVYQALLNLGFRREEIQEALRMLPANLEKTEEIVKFALKKLAANRRE